MIAKSRTATVALTLMVGLRGDAVQNVTMRKRTHSRTTAFDHRDRLAKAYWRTWSERSERSADAFPSKSWQRIRIRIRIRENGKKQFAFIRQGGSFSPLERGWFDERGVRISDAIWFISNICLINVHQIHFDMRIILLQIGTLDLLKV